MVYLGVSLLEKTIVIDHTFWTVLIKEDTINVLTITQIQ